MDSNLASLEEAPEAGETFAEKLRRLCCCRLGADDVVQGTIHKRDMQQEAEGEQGTIASTPVISPQPHGTPAQEMQAVLPQSPTAEELHKETTAEEGSSARAVAALNMAISFTAQDPVAHPRLTVFSDRAEQSNVLQLQQQSEMQTAHQVTQQPTFQAHPNQQSARQQLLLEQVTQQQLIKEPGQHRFCTTEKGPTLGLSARTGNSRESDVLVDRSPNSSTLASAVYSTELQVSRSSGKRNKGSHEMLFAPALSVYIYRSCSLCVVQASDITRLLDSKGVLGGIML